MSSSTNLLGTTHFSQALIAFSATSVATTWPFSQALIAFSMVSARIAWRNMHLPAPAKVLMVGGIHIQTGGIGVEP